MEPWSHDRQQDDMFQRTDQFLGNLFVVCLMDPWCHDRQEDDIFRRTDQYLGNFYLFACSGTLKPWQTRGWDFRKTDQFLGNLFVACLMEPWSNDRQRDEIFRGTDQFLRPIPKPPGGNQSFYNSVKADGGYKTQNKTLCYLIGTFGYTTGPFEIRLLKPLSICRKRILFAIRQICIWT